MPNRLQKLIYYLSAGAPILLVFAIVYILKYTNDEWQSFIFPILLILISIVLIKLFNISFNYANKNLPQIPVKVIEISGDDGLIVAYVISYLLPFASLGNISIIAPVAVIIFVLLMVVLTFTDYVTPHFILFCRGYHFYEVNIENARRNMKIVSKKRLRGPSDIKYVKRVFESLLIKS